MADANPQIPGSQAPKKETVRITLPPQPSNVPVVKRETARLPGVGTNPPTPPSAPKPFIPLGAAPKPMAPLGGSAPKPPSLPAKPTVPLTPAPAPAAPADAGVAAKGVAPKKETSRIPATSAAKPVLPKATVRMGQTQVLSNAPAPASTTPAAPAKTAETAAAAADPLVMPLSIGVLVASIVALIFAFLAFAA